jgi:hypothetical protein
MPAQREWTGSVAVLPESMAAFAVEMSNKAYEARGELRSSERSDVDHALSELVSFLQDHASTLAEWSDAVRELYVRLDEPKDEFPTNAQGVALARFLRPAFRDDVRPADRYASVSRGGEGLGDSYLLVRLADGYTGGIDREGRTST